MHISAELIRLPCSSGCHSNVSQWLPTNSKLLITGHVMYVVQSMKRVVAE
jgi:hypothetical protein